MEHNFLECKFSVDWHIKCLSLHPTTPENWRIVSESFKVEFLGGTVLRLELNPGYILGESPPKMSLYIRRLDEYNTEGYESLENVQFGCKITPNYDIRPIQFISLRSRESFQFRDIAMRPNPKCQFSLSVEDEFQLRCEFFECETLWLEHKAFDYIGLSRDLEEILKKGRFSDVLIQCKSKEFKVHRNILMARGSGFIERLCPGFDENNVASVVTNIPSYIMGTILFYFYTGRLEENAFSTEELFNVIRQYNLDDLEKKMISYPKSARLYSCLNYLYKRINCTLYLGNVDYCLVNTVAIETLYFPELNIIFRTKRLRLTKKTYEHVISIKFGIESFKPDQPVFFFLYARYVIEGRVRVKILKHIFTNSKVFDAEIETMGSFANDTPVLMDCEILIRDGEVESFPKNNWNENIWKRPPAHLNKLSRELGEMRRRNLYADYTLVCNGNEFQAHKNMLLARSSFLDRDDDGVEHDIPIDLVRRLIEDTELTAERMEWIMHFIYTGCMQHLSQTDARSIKRCAIRYKVNDLKRRCDKLLTLDYRPQ